MSRKKNPIIGVMDFFEHGGIETVQTVLALVQEIVRKRTPFPSRTERRPHRKTQAAPTPAPEPAPAPLADVAAAEAASEAPRRRRRIAKPPVPTTPPPDATAVSGEVDLALPGLGPSTIGE